MTAAGAAPLVNGLKSAFKRVLKDLGGIDAAAGFTRVGRSQLSDYGNVDSEKLPPVDVVLDLEMAGGHPHVTKALAAAQNFMLLPADRRPSAVLANCLARISVDNGRLFADAATALTGAAMPDKTRQKLLDDLTDVVHAALEARAALAEDTK